MLTHCQLNYFYNLFTDNLQAGDSYHYESTNGYNSNPYGNQNTGYNSRGTTSQKTWKTKKNKFINVFICRL